MAADVASYSPDQALELMEAMAQPLPAEIADFEGSLAELFDEGSLCQWIVVGRQKNTTDPLILHWGAEGRTVSEEEMQGFSRRLHIKPFLIFREQVVGE